MSDFWAKRKASVAAEARAEEAHQAARQRMAEEAKIAEKTDEELLEEHGFCAPEDIQDSEQVRAFLKAALPQRLKTRALRRLWGLNPVLANIDGLVDYGEDFTDSAMVVENLQTVYQVGKGMMSKLEDLAGLDAETEPVGETPGPAPQSEAEPANAPTVVPAQVAFVTQPEETEEPEEPADAEAPAPVRRMQFRFPQATQQG